MFTLNFVIIALRGYTGAFWVLLFLIAKQSLVAEKCYRNTLRLAFQLLTQIVSNNKLNVGGSIRSCIKSIGLFHAFVRNSGNK
jgi:hypothetical protein